MTELETVYPEEEHSSSRKSFWQHLEDLRTTMVQCLMVVGIGLVGCLFISDKLMWIFEYPLRHIEMFEQPKPTVSFKIGSTTLGPYVVSRDQFSGMPPGPASQVLFKIGTAKVGGEQVVTLNLDPEPVSPAITSVRLRTFGPAEAFFIAFRVSLYSSIIIAAPFWLYFVGKFVLPALKIREKRILFVWLGWGVALFLLGVLTTYFLLLPVALRASLQYSELLGFEGNEWRAGEYISFCSNFMLGMGFGFQFPLVLLTLVKFGIIDHRFLAKYRRHAVVVSFILGAVLTTPEVITQVAMAIPLYLLYEACIWIAWYWDWKKRRKVQSGT